MPDSSEPEKYSLDEMMDRLQSRPSEDPIEQGELVTRADGSKAIRVRKRKRRSHQPHKEEQKQKRRVRMIQLSGAILLLCAAGLAAGGAMVFANSAPFRHRLQTGITKASGAVADLREFRVNPRGANAGTLEMKWPAGHVMRNLFLRGLQAELFPATFLGKKITGEEAKAEYAALELDFPIDGEKRSAVPADSAAMEIAFKRYAAARLDLIVGDRSAPLLRVLNSEFSFQPYGGGNRPQLLLNRGDLRMPALPSMRIDRGHIEFRGDQIDVVGLRLLHETENRGEFKISGTVTPFDTGRMSTVEVELVSFPFDGLVGAQLGKVFSGRVDTTKAAKSNFLSFTPSREPDAVLAVTFENSLGNSFELSRFPCFILIARLLDDKWFERPVFVEDAHGTLRRADGALVLADLVFENKSRIAVHGGLRLTPDNRLTGQIRLGLAEAMVKASQNRRLDALFGPLENGFRWVDLTISGQGDAPADNFSALYDAIPAIGRAPVSPEATPSFEELTRPE